MTKFIGVLSGKGGVGKTTVAINLGIALHDLSKDVIVVDGNLTTPDIGLYLGVPKLPVTLHDFLEGKKKILESIYEHPSGLKIIPASIGLDAFKNLNLNKLKDIVKQLKGISEIIIVDLAPGIGKDILSFVKLMDEVLIVTNPELTAVTDALRIIKIIEDSSNSSVIGVILNRVKGDNIEMQMDNISSLLDKPVISIIPESEDFRKAVNIKQPLVYAYPNSKPSQAFNHLASCLTGENYEGNILLEKEGGFLVFLLKKFGFLK